MDACDVDQLVEQYGDAVYRYCRSLTYTLEDAEDLYQQTFLKTLELKKKIRPDQNPKAYIISIAANLWRNHKSQYARRQRIAPCISDQTEGLQLEDQAGDADVLENVIRQEDLGRLRDSVAGLPEKQRQVVLLYYAGELTIEEIARILHVPKGTVKSRLYHAKEQLRSEMEGQ